MHVEPRASDGRSSHTDFRIIWLPGQGKNEVIVACGSAPVQCTLARHGNRFGLRAHASEAIQIHEKYRSGIPYLQGDDRTLFVVGPFPEGCTKSALQRVLGEWKWDARPLHPKGRTADATGISWVIQASHSPSHWVYTCSHGDVLIAYHPKQLPSKPNQVLPPVLASSHTLGLLSKDCSIADDPLQKNDPWAPKGPSGSKTSSSVNLNPAQLAELEQKIHARIQPKTMPDVDMLPKGVSEAMESKFAEMEKRQLNLEARLDQCQQQVTHQHQQMSQSVQVLAGRVDAQGRQMESTLASHIERIEALFSKRSRVGE